MRGRQRQWRGAVSWPRQPVFCPALARRGIHPRVPRVASTAHRGPRKPAPRPPGGGARPRRPRRVHAVVVTAAAQRR